MASRIDVVLRKIPKQLKAIQSQYKRDLTNREISDDLLHEIARFIEDCQRVLDWTATDIDRAHGKASDRSPYYPLSDAPAKFAAAMKRDFATVPQPVYDAMERHQPYQQGKETLGHLHDLARVTAPPPEARMRRVCRVGPRGSALRQRSFHWWSPR